MRFAYDPEKSEANRLKHGIDFEEAKALWNDADLMTAPTKTADETRYIAIGKIGAKHWAAIYTERDGTIRLISVRRARGKEIDWYEGA